MKRHRPGLIGFVVLLLAALFNLAALYTAERSFVDLRDAAGSVRRTQLAQNLIERLYRLVVDAETGQRGYFLTGDQTYLVPYHDAVQQNKQHLAELFELVRDNRVQLAQLATVRSLLDARLAQIEESLALKRSGDNEGVQAFMASKKGAVTMDSLRLAINGMAAEEARLHERRLQSFTENQDRVREGFIVVAIINLLLVTLGGIFLSQDARRRNREAIEAEKRNLMLAQTVSESTAELTELSHYLQRLQEEEKAKIAREIHDELGGTLAAAKIDLQLLSDKLVDDSPHQTRIARIMLAIDDAIQVKRRIIEDLRPTMLDSLGIAAALKWQCSQFSKRSGGTCRVELQDENLRLSPAYSIAFYRVTQEALTNISKHAQAKNVVIALQRDGDDWLLRIADDGVGIDVGKRQNPTAHGLLSMRERMRALGGQFSIQGRPGRGTVIEIRAPLEKELAAAKER
jgi:signal transduction histidine kinase